MNNEDILLVCLMCGDTMDCPSDEIIEKFGTAALKCCDFDMARVNKENLYKLLKSLDKLKATIEHEITKDF